MFVFFEGLSLKKKKKIFFARWESNFELISKVLTYICYFVHLKACFHNYVIKPWCYFPFLVLIVQLFHRNSKIHKNITRKIEFRETNFHDRANFNNFFIFYFRNLGPKSRKQIPRIFVLLKLKFLPVKSSINKVILKQEKLKA